MPVNAITGSVPDYELPLAVVPVRLGQRRYLVPPKDVENFQISVRTTNELSLSGSLVSQYFVSRLDISIYNRLRQK